MGISTLAGNGQAIGVVTVSLTPASVATATSAEQTFTVNGLKTTDFVAVNPPSSTTGTGIASVRVSAADTLAITFINATGGSLTPAAGSYKVMYFRPEGTITMVTA